MKYKYKPKNKEELILAIRKEICKETSNNFNWQTDLNCIDTSLITDMSNLFSEEYGLEKFNGDISNWNVSNVKNMSWLFYKSKFNKDISKWNTSNVTNMSWMFAYSDFNQDISKWNVNNVKILNYTFIGSKFNKDISNWNINNIKDMKDMFKNSQFNGDIGSWPLKETTGLENISVSLKYDKLPDKIIYPETIANIFIRSVKNPDDTFNIDNFKQILKNYLNNRKKLYKNRNYKLKIIKKLILNDMADILKHIKDKNMQDKFIEITINKEKKELNINLD